VIPDAWRAEEGTSGSLPRLAVSEQFAEHVGEIRLESHPGVLTSLVEYTIKGWRSDNLTASAASVARLDYWQRVWQIDHSRGLLLIVIDQSRDGPGNDCSGRYPHDTASRRAL
jgi:hypothetical protein